MNTRWLASALAAGLLLAAAGIIKDGWSIGTHEFITEKADYAGQKFRVLVEVKAKAPAPKK
jgi:hypothetical protein